MTPAERLAGRTPSGDDIEAIARQTLRALPEPFATSLSDIVLEVVPVVDAATARQLGLRRPMQLSGLYEGVSLNRRSVEQSGVLPERITLYSRPLLAEWKETRFSLEQIVRHVVIHEVGHHFGFSDDDMHALEGESE